MSSQNFLTYAAVLLTLVAVPAVGSECSTASNYTSLMGLGSGGCTLNDLVFSNFAFTASATGTGVVPTSDLMTFTLDNPGTGGTGQQIWGFEFDPNLSVLGIGSENIQIQYDVTAPALDIESIHLNETADASGNATATVAEGPDCGKLTIAGGCTFLTTLAVTPSDPHQDLLGVGPFITLHVIEGITVLSIDPNGTVTLSGVRNAVDETTSAVPEPTLPSLVLAALALIGIGHRLRPCERGVSK